MIIEVFIKGNPKAQPRAKATTIGGKTRMYTPGTAKDWKTAIAAGLVNSWNERLTGPIKIDLVFIMPRPKSLMRKKDPFHRIPHTKKPDSDNLEKAVFDAITDCGLWKDDSQVYDSHVVKMYADKIELTGVHITIEGIA